MKLDFYDAPCSLKTDTWAVCDMLAKPHRTMCRNFIDLRHQLLQKMITANTIKVHHVRSSQQKAYMLTEPLQLVMFQRQCMILQIQKAASNGGVWQEL